ncbi:phage portal protein [Mycolicibacterium celeriflavum]|nr:phage portal protein [Mycolicibacterium celeriflavum]
MPEPYEPPETRDWSIADPFAAHLFGGGPALSGVSVTEQSAMGLSAVYRCVQLLSGTIATLPLRTVHTDADGTTRRVSSWLDNPAGPDGPTAHEFIEGLMVALLLRGNFHALKVFNGAGVLHSLQPLPSQCVGIDIKNGRKVYRVQLENGTSKELTDREILHIPGLSLDGVRGVSPISIARQSLGTAIAGERSAGRLFHNGALMSAIVTPTEDLTSDEAEVVRDTLDRVVGGERNAGSMAVFSKALNVSQWSVDPVNAQFLESRKFSTSEVARWFGVPPHLIGDVERSTSWGSGITEQTLAFQKFTLQQWTSRIEARLSRLFDGSRKVEFDFRQLFAGTPDQEIELLMKQTGNQPILTVDEARQILNRPAMPQVSQELPEGDDA